MREMESMQSSIVSVNNNNNEKIYIKQCTRPTAAQTKTTCKRTKLLINEFILLLKDNIEI